MGKILVLIIDAPFKKYLKPNFNKKIKMTLKLLKVWFLYLGYGDTTTFGPLGAAGKQTKGEMNSIPHQTIADVLQNFNYGHQTDQICKYILMNWYSTKSHQRDSSVFCFRQWPTTMTIAIFFKDKISFP